MGGNLLPRNALMETLHLGSQHVLTSQWGERFQASLPATVITAKLCMGAWQRRVMHPGSWGPEVARGWELAGLTWRRWVY